MGQHALFIGIDDYPFAPLTSCVNDTVAMRDLLVSLGVFQAGECTMMTSPACAAGVVAPTRKAILAFLVNFYDAAVPLDRLLVFYAGHGLSVRLGRAADQLRTIIVPAGVEQLKNCGDELIDLDELVGRFARRGAQEQYWIIDACRNELPGALPNVAEIGWDLPAAGDPREALEMAQGVLYAVAPLGQAQAAAGGHGVLTGHLLDALARRGNAEWGGGGWYDEARDHWLFDLESLADYARRRIRTISVMADWQAQYLLPRCWSGETKPGPLMAVKTIRDRPFAVLVDPPEAAAAILVALKVKRNTVAAWPPRGNGEKVELAPERYRLDAQLVEQAANWLPPQIPDPPVVDLREVDRLIIALRRSVPTAPSEATLPGDLSVVPSTGRPSLAVTPVEAVFVPSSKRSFAPEFFYDIAGQNAPGHGLYVPSEPTLIVHAIDPGVTAHLVRLTGGKEERDESPNQQITLSEGLWRVEIRIGTEIIGVREEDFAAGEHYDIAATAQVTPALAALLPDPAEEASAATHAPRLVLQPSETIGPMQGAILPTLLPLLALKPLDLGNQVLSSFSPRLAIKTVKQQTPVPLAVAVAFDGPWHAAQLRTLADALSVEAGATANLVWQDGSARVSLFMIDDLRRSELLAVVAPGWGTASVAAPQVPNYCTTVALTLWPDGRHDVSVSLFKLPPGTDEMLRPGRLSRALAIACRLYAAGGSIDNVDYDVFSMISSGSYGDPVLGAIAWFARARRLSTDRALSFERRYDLEARQRGIGGFLTATVPQLGDTRVIAALSSPQASLTLDELLGNPTTPQPVLADALSALARRAIARGQLDHWAVARFQQLAPSAVFNVTTQPTRPGEDAAQP